MEKTRNFKNYLLILSGLVMMVRPTIAMQNNIGANDLQKTVEQKFEKTYNLKTNNDLVELKMDLDRLITEGYLPHNIDITIKVNSSKIIETIFSDKNYNFSVVGILDLSNNEIDNNGMYAIAYSKLINLEELYLANNKIGVIGLAHLGDGNLKKLRKLDLSSNPIGIEEDE